ncbi:hypothetical protein BDZ90DRAFT_230466 [Jaminaea rosea]|uniref:Amino acid transporter transmembrane domain-containing protein n=1 Tax=Jaminaea rosea TaxID=1569628 RepID=A0A316UWJ8_9BASI|nr:hypothetical protein BDZ90DRAFT_230466 [Jaminaea rosea]PWN29602.1 hypothetical protein BDZ90DRAFT_230466 [Jaminaea rosea]
MDLSEASASAKASGSKSVRFADNPERQELPARGTLFSIDGDDDAAVDDNDDDGDDAHRYGPSWAASSSSSSSGATYGLKSTIPSREAEFDAASDTLSEDDQAIMDDAESSTRAMMGRSSSRNKTVPLPSSIRQSVDVFGSNMSEFRRSVMEGVDQVGRSTGLSADNGELPDWLKRGAGVFDATTNMANSILGAGIVGLPYSMRQSGFVAGVVLLVGLAMLTDWTIRLIILNSKLSGRQTYIEIMDHCFGRKGKAAVSLFQFAFAFGGMCAFCVVIGDTIPHVLAAVFPSLAPGESFFSFLVSRSFVITFTTLLISYPLSLYRDIENLSKASAVAMVSMLLIVLTVVFRGPAMPAELKGDPSLRFTVVNPSHLVSSISVISFAFVCHHNSLLIYASLKEPSMDKFSKVTHYSTTIACACLTAMSIAGYWTFEEKTLGNVLNNFPENDTFVNIARFAFGVNMFTTFPLEAFVCREVLETYFFPNQYSVRLHITITTSLVLASLVVSLLTCDLGIVLELTGGLSATALAFIFPAVCFLKLAAEGEGKALGVGSVRRGGGGGDYAPVSASDNGNGVQGDEDEDDSLAELEASHGPRGGRQSSSNRADISIDEVQLPLAPGASIRARRPNEAKHWYTWWLSTKPLAVGCALFGTVVLIVSVGQALAELFSGRARGVTHTC